MNQVQTLEPGTVLRSPMYTYNIEKVLGQGSFGITYLANTKIKIQGQLGELESEIKVAIKEYYLSEICNRNNDGSVSLTKESKLVSRYGDKFRKEAINLSHLQHPNIVTVLEVFDANATHYYVMKYIEGSSLDEYINRIGCMPINYAKTCIKNIANAIKYMHEQKMLHLDLKPKNIMLRIDGHIFLIDFGLSKQYELDGEPESSTTVGLGTPGYAPIEQANVFENKTFSATLDIYALGATFFKMITGETPPVASIILNDREILHRKMQEQPIQVIKLIEKMMSPEKVNRPQNIDEFLVLLNKLPVNKGTENNNVDYVIEDNNVIENEKTIIKDKISCCTDDISNDKNRDMQIKIDNLCSMKRYKEAYILCLESIRTGSCGKDFALKKADELIPIIRRNSKKKNRIQVLIAIIVCILLMILSVVLQMN
jgi:serine/threonine protein kinase